MSLVCLNQLQKPDGDFFFESSEGCYKTEYDVVEDFIAMEGEWNFEYVRSIIIDVRASEIIWKGDIHNHPCYDEIYRIRELKSVGEYVPEPEYDLFGHAKYGLV